MPKILLVEDDNNLREIYEARLQAEGYTIVSARDGEEALVVAKAEKPDLVISDVMMPKISGFEMLDILRNTDGLKDVKVIMLTALGQSDDQKRADKLGADRYLVKSQVTLEDIVKAAQELLGGEQASASLPDGATDTPTSTATPSADEPATPPPAPVAEADAVKPAPDETPDTATAPAVPGSDSAHDKLMADAVDTLVADTEKNATPTADEPATAAPAETTPPPADNEPPSKHKKIIKPIDSEPKKDIQALLAEEEAKETGSATPADAAPAAEEAKAVEQSDQAASTTAAEEAAVEAKIEDFVAGATTEPSAPNQSPTDTAQPTATPTTPAEKPAEKKINVTNDSPASASTTAPAPAKDTKDSPDPNSIAL
jgi:CheY-like chemotaxis protein